MNYQQTIDFLFNSLPEFQRVGQAAYKANLDNTLALDNHLGNPHKSFKTIHIAGTNGKGSVSQMLCEVLRQAGMKVGLYTSPHLRDFRERIVVDGQMISQEEVVAFVERNYVIINDLRPSFFEMTVAMAFDYFRAQRVDIAVVEVGMGGRLDSTNIVTPILSVITNIDYDHQQFLGDTLPLIAAEKGGIIKPGVPVVVGETNPETAPVFIEKAKELLCPITFADQRYRCTAQNGNIFTIASLLSDYVFDLELGMAGSYQRKNICTALAALDIISENLPIDQDIVSRGLRRTTVMGRWQKIADSPLTICDTGHNKAGMSYVVEQIEAQKYEKLYFIIGMVGDKDIAGVVALLPRQAYYIYTQAPIARAMECEKLAAIGLEHGLQGECVATVEGALVRARELATERDMIFIGGSTFVVAQIV